MADPRLQWRQLSAPDLSAASAALARAGDSFNRGMETGSDILSKYQSGLESKADAEVMQELAGISSEEELDTWLQGGGLEGRSVSKDMLNTLYGHRAESLDFANQRSITSDRLGRLGLAQQAGNRAEDLHGIAMDDNLWRQGRRSELAGLSDEVVAARSEGQQHGRYGVSTESAQSQVYQGLINRGMPSHIAEGFMMNFQDESGFNVGVTESVPNVHGTRGKGLYQLTGPRREKFETKYGKDGYTIDNQLDFLMEELNTTEAGAWDVIRQSQNAGEAGSNIVNNFLRPAAEHARSRTAKYVGANGFDIKAATADVRSGATPARDILSAAVSNSEFLSLEDVNSILSGSDKAIEEGDTRLAEELAQSQRDATAAFISAAVSNPNNITPDQVAKAVEDAAKDSGNFSSSEALTARFAAEAMISESASLQTELAPAVAEDVALNRAIEDSLAFERRQFEGDDQNRALGDISRYYDDPTTSLITDLGLGKDGENPDAVLGLFGESGFDENKMRNLINEYANEFGVVPEVVAVAMRDVFNRDPYGRNTIRSRFNKDAVQTAVEQLSPESRRDYDRGSSRLQIQETQVRQLENQRNRFRTQLAKMKENDPRRSALESQIQALDAQMAAIFSTQVAEEARQ